MKLTISITMDNAAFEVPNGDELARVLHKLAKRLEGFQWGAPSSFALVDSNGNKVGEAEISA